ncbi:sce7726 family protein [Companilactobacillus huachuanensis]|uniref:Sce7726 family protein n=1 Tax=Companilactobacillus huachuanensis TaxID=2559914 RepID=A0ABW1RPV1_9LACO|nr:sce7726 family protein [Companilactobacillus huachuanensis]
MTTATLINKMFTVNSLKRIISNPNNRTYSKTVNTVIGNQDSVDTNLDALKKVYKYMSKNHRNEYFYKNTLVNKILLGKHSVRTSTAIRELPILNNILDLLIINGTGQVYEIKTGLDNLMRLNDQLSAYYMVFSYCNVVTDMTHLQAIKEMLQGTPTGIILLTDRGTLHVEKKSEEYNDRLDNKTIFNVLRKYEFENIISSEYGFLPDTTQSKYYDACFEIFEKMDVKKSQKYMLKELKNRSYINKNNYGQFNRVPAEIKSLVYFSDYSEIEYRNLNSFLNNKYDGKA